MRREELAALRARIGLSGAGPGVLRAACETLLGEIARQRAIMIEVAVPMVLLHERIVHDRVAGLGPDLTEGLLEAADILRREVA